MADLTRGPQRLERLHRFGQRMAAAPVQQIEIDPVGTSRFRLRSHAAGTPVREALCG